MPKLWEQPNDAAGFQSGQDQTLPTISMSVMRKMDEEHQRGHPSQGSPFLIDHPPHYTAGAVEVIDIIEQIVKQYEPIIGWNVGQAIKYLARAPLKGSLDQDLKKAQWYINRAVGHSSKLPLEHS